jgi:hydroxypyruvate isomerase
MPRFAANLSLMYGEWPFAERAAQAAADGFEAVECQFPYGVPAAELAKRLGDSGATMVLINAPPGDEGDRGLAALPGREAAFRRSFLDQALPYAVALRCPNVHVMAGTVPAGIEPARCAAVFEANLAWAAAQAAGADVTVLIEPLNPRDAPGYFLSHQAQAHDTVAAVASPRLAVQMDLYHLQITEGDVSTRLKQYLPPNQATRVGHLQVAGVPDRHEPDEGELSFDHLCGLIDDLGWTGWVGAEYRPRRGTRAGLGWWHRWQPGGRLV